MRILLDESLPRRLGSVLRGHEVSTVQEMGWSGIDNGELLRLASVPFDAFLTADQNLSFQQNLTDLSLAVIVLVAPSNRLESLTPLVPEILKTLPNTIPGKAFRVSG